MAENVITLKEKKENPNEKVESFLVRNRTFILACSALVVVAAVVVCVVVGITDSHKKKALAALDAVEYSFTKSSADLSEDDAEARRNAALEGLGPYLSKGGVAGTRANMLAADIAFQREDFEQAQSFYLAAAAASKKAYTAPLCYYNAAVCAEHLGNVRDAVAYYRTASEAKDFLLVTHALFSLGRALEEVQDYAAASEAYRKLVDSYPSDEWTKLAQTRLVALGLNSFAE